jgi:hypothetical protein
MPDASVDLIITSPPYFALRSYRDGNEHYAGQIGSEPTPQDFLEALWACTAEWIRVLKPSGSMFINLGDKHSSGERLDSDFTVEDAAWLAGVIDCDGSISIRVDNGGRSHITWVRVGQMKPEVVTRIKQVTGTGQVWQDKRGVWNWNAAAQQAKWVLERIWPWLRIKQRQALAGVALMAHKQEKGGRGRWNMLSDDDLTYREAIRQAVLDWNAGRANDWQPPPLSLPEIPARARWLPAKSLMGLPWRYAIGCIDRLGLILRAEVVWSKPNGLPESVTDRVRRSHEQWFHFTKQGRYFAAVDEIRTPLADKTLTHRGGGTAYGDGANHYSHDLEAHGSGWGSGEAKVRRPDPRGALPSSVWVIPSEPLLIPDWAKEKYALPDHFAAFPQEWPRRIILGWSPSGICTVCGKGRRPVTAHEYVPARARGGDGSISRVRPLKSELGDSTAKRTGQGASFNKTVMDKDVSITGYACACPAPDAPTRPAVVVDPFGGTGTVAMVAKALGRTGISVDLSADYCKLARWRIEESRHGAKAEDRTWAASQGRLI